MYYEHEHLTERLVAARKYRKLSQSDIAKAFGIEAGSYSKWERGKAVPRAKQIADLANIEKLDINYYFDPSMTLEKADLTNTAERDTLRRMAEQIETLQSKIVPDAKFDPLAHAVKTKKPLRELVETLTKLDESALLEARGLIHGYLFGQEKKLEREAEEKGRQNAG